MDKVEALDAVEKLVRSQTEAVLETQAFSDWYSGTARNPDDLVLLNNSFVYRDGVNTTKSPYCLCLTCQATGDPATFPLEVVHTTNFNADFDDKYNAKHASPPDRDPLAVSILSQLDGLGRLVFVLAGEIDETITVEEEIKSGYCGTLRFNPSCAELLSVTTEPAIEISSLADAEQLWPELLTQAAAAGLPEPPEAFDGLFAGAIAALRDKAYCSVGLPASEPGCPEKTMLGRLSSALKEQCDDYRASFEQWQASGYGDRQAHNNLMRIAYNFVSDASRFVPLLISICDLKPIILWCTIGSHYRLADAFRSLPWARETKKANLKAYESRIKNARNHAFHDFFGFDRSLEVDVTDLSLRVNRMVLFPTYGPNKSNELEYEDQEIAKLLLGFRRVPETPVPPEFWRRNLAVIEAAHDLLVATRVALELLWQATRTP